MEFVAKNLFTRKTPNSDGIFHQENSKFYQIFKEEITSILHKLFWKLKKKSWLPVHFMRPTLLAYKSSQRHYKKGPLQTNIAQEPLPASVSLSVQWASLGTKWDSVGRGPGMEPDASSHTGGQCGGGVTSDSLQPGLRLGLQCLSNKASLSFSSRVMCFEASTALGWMPSENKCCCCNLWIII